MRSASIRYRTLFGGDGFDDIKLVLGVEGDTDVIPPGFGIQCQSSFYALIVVVSDDLYNCKKKDPLNTLKLNSWSIELY